MWIEVERFRVSLLMKDVNGKFDRIAVLHEDDFYDLFQVDLKGLPRDQKFKVEVKLKLEIGVAE